MEKVKITLIEDPINQILYTEVDNGEWSTIKLNGVLRQLLRIIKNPDRYEVTYIKHTGEG